MYPLCACIVASVLLIANNNNMKSFKNFLIEEALLDNSHTQEQMQCDINGICKVVKEYESGGAGEKILSPYKDSKGLPTIGHGHLITKESPKIFGEVFAEEQKTNPNFATDVLSGKTKLTMDQADKLLKRDVTTRIPQVKKLIPKFDTFSPELQAQLASEHFRGMLGKSPKAVQMINTGDFSGASSEYLNAKDYRESVKQKTGIAGRMQKLSDTLKTESTRRKVPGSSV